MKIKNTTRVLYDLVQNERNNKERIVENTGLSLQQVTNTIKFLKRGGLIKVEYFKTENRPYRKAIYSISPSRQKYVLNLVSRRLKDVY